jgi:hypothetical protein
MRRISLAFADRQGGEKINNYPFGGEFSRIRQVV